MQPPSLAERRRRAGALRAAGSWRNYAKERAAAHCRCHAATRRPPSRRARCLRRNCVARGGTKRPGPERGWRTTPTPTLPWVGRGPGAGHGGDGDRERGRCGRRRRRRRRCPGRERPRLPAAAVRHQRAAPGDARGLARRRRRARAAPAPGAGARWAPAAGGWTGQQATAEGKAATEGAVVLSAVGSCCWRQARKLGARRRLRPGRLAGASAALPRALRTRAMFAAKHPGHAVPGWVAVPPGLPALRHKGVSHLGAPGGVGG